MTQGLTSYPLARSAVSAAPRGGFLAYARGLSLGFWLLTLMVPFLKIRDWSSYGEVAQEGTDFRTYYFVGFAIALLAQLTLGPGSWFAAPFKVTSTWSGRLFTAFCFVALVVSPISLTPKASAIYALATWLVYLILYQYWQGDYRILQRTTVIAGWIVFAWLFFLMLKLHVNVGYAIGGINRNTTGFAGLGGMICCMISPNRKVRWAAIGVALFMALIVNSRGSLIAFGAFMAVYYGVNKGTTRFMVHAVVGVALCCLVAMAIPQLRTLVFDNVFLLNDKSRGIGSGFTGRVDLWKQALASFWKEPIFGHGFRATNQGGHGDYGGIHSGYLKLLVETGIVGTTLAVLALVVELVRRYTAITQMRAMNPAAAPNLDIVESIRINSVVSGTLAMTLTYWVYEQLYLNLGTTVAVVLLLMMVAPIYITSQGRPIHK